MTRYAIKQAVLLNKISTKYISRILSAYERENVKTVQQAQERERKYNVSKSKKYIERVPDWLDKNFSKQEATIEEQQEIKELLSKYE